LSTIFPELSKHLFKKAILKKLISFYQKTVGPWFNDPSTALLLTVSRIAYIIDSNYDVKKAFK